jgi:hypothetical protein
MAQIVSMWLALLLPELVGALADFLFAVISHHLLPYDFQ